MAESSELNVDTPFLQVDLDILEGNIARISDFAKRSGLALRPHAKTHKCLEIGKLQLASGAVGLTLATVGEAEVFADGGFEDIFIAYPVWPSEQRAARLAALNERIRLSVGVDSIETAKLLGKAVPGLRVLVEVDSGHHRSGCAPEEAGAVAGAAAKAGLEVAGVFTFPGHSYSPGAASSAAESEAAAMKVASDSLAKAGIEAPIRSGGSTPSWSSTDSSMLTEFRPGVYVFNDAQQIELGNCSFKDIALTVSATVVSRHGREVIVDSGSKTFGADRAAWASGYGRILGSPEARIVALSEHHATVEIPAGELPELGSRIQVVPNHVCNTVNLAESLFVARGGVVQDVWTVAARGRNS